MRELSADEVIEEASFIRRDAGWPCWPVLPVKNIHRGDAGHPDDEEIGIMIAGAGPKIWLMNMMELETGSLGPQVEHVRVLEFDSYEDLVRSGWVGD